MLHGKIKNYFSMDSEKDMPLNLIEKPIIF